MENTSEEKVERRARDIWCFRDSSLEGGRTIRFRQTTEICHNAADAERKKTSHGQQISRVRVFEKKKLLMTQSKCEMCLVFSMLLY